MARTAVHQPELGCWIPQSKADARLIAAAPDLLEALHAMLSHTAMLDPSQGFDGFDYSAVNQARAAIAKADGKP
jgi:hypothetical protein